MSTKPQQVKEAEALTADMELPEGWAEALLPEISANNKFAIVDGPFGSDLKLSDYVVEFIAAAEKMRAEKPKNLMAAGNELVQKFLDAGLKRLKNKPD